jgi:hypothetical protein
MSSYATNFRYSTEKPPMLEVCEKYFGASWDRGTIFAYGDTIHAKNPSRITPDVEVHELVHLKQQKEIGKDLWWDMYLKDPKFRCNQELQAYKAQLAYALEKYPRNHRKALKKHILNSFSGLSGGTISLEQAEQLLS